MALRISKTIPVLRETWRQIQSAQILLVASSLAYTTILSIIPLLAVSFAIFQAFGGLEKLYSTVEPFIIENLAESASADAMETIRKFIGNAHAGAVGISGFIGLVFTSMSALSSAEKAINRIWNTEITRSIFERIASYWFFITLGPLGLAVTVGALSGGGFQGMKFFPSGSASLVVSIIAFFIVNKWIPNRKVHWAPALISAVVTAILLGFAKFLYSIYTKNVLTYSKIYGSIGAVPIVLLWIYIAWTVVLSGSALAASLQKHMEEN